MQNSERRVVITGLGLISPLGIGTGPFWNALAEGRGAVQPIQAFPIEGLPINAGGEVLNFDPKSLANPKHKTTFRKSLKYMARDIQLAVAAAELAMADAGLNDGGVDPTRIGVDLGAGLISSDLDELAPAINLATHADDSFDYKIYGRDGLNEIDPLWLLKYLPNMLACHISILNDCQGPSNSITEAEAASNIAIGEATRIIARGRADVMVSGGAGLQDSSPQPDPHGTAGTDVALGGRTERGLPAIRPSAQRLGCRGRGRYSDPRRTRARAPAGCDDLRRNSRLR